MQRADILNHRLAFRRFKFTPPRKSPPSITETNHFPALNVNISKTNEDRPVLSATALYNPLNVLFNILFFALICRRFIRKGLQKFINLRFISKVLTVMKIVGFVIIIYGKRLFMHRRKLVAAKCEAAI